MKLIPGYDLDKAAQVAAFFALKAGGEINVLKLSKLMYLAERESMRLYDEPMFYDRYVSMPDGPVASITLNFINGNISDDRWGRFVGQRSGYDIPLADKNIDIDRLDHISEAEIDILQGLWRKFGPYTHYKIRDWTHDPGNIPEWVDPQGSSDPIPYERIFDALHKPDGKQLEDDICEYRRVSESLRLAS